MGQSFFFNFWTPTGNYKLNLANILEREILVVLIVLNKEVNKKILAGQLADRS